MTRSQRTVPLIAALAGMAATFALGFGIGNEHGETQGQARSKRRSRAGDVVPLATVTPERSPALLLPTQKTCIAIGEWGSRLAKEMGSYVTIAWRAEVTNICAEPLRVRADFKAQDVDGYTLDTTTVRETLKPGLNTLDSTMFVERVIWNRYKKSAISVRKR